MTNDEKQQSAALDVLVEHIVSEHHALLHRELPLIGALLTAHVRACWTKHPELLKAHTLFAQLRAQLEQHLIMEETAGFPLISRHAQDPSTSVTPFVNTMDGHLEVHAQVTSLLAQIKATLWNYEVPADLGSEVACTCARLQHITEDLAVHVHLENDILFPRVRAVAQAA